MNALSIVAAFFVVEANVIAACKKHERRSTDDEMAILNTKYTLDTSPLGGFLCGPIWQSSSTVGTVPETTAYLVVVNDGVCGQFNTFTKERLCLWHLGKTMVDIFYGDGIYTPKCLGDPLEDDACSYEVYIPANATSNIRPVDRAVFTGIVFQGTVEDGSGRDYDDVLAENPTHASTIALTEPCYST